MTPAIVDRRADFRLPQLTADQVLAGRVLLDEPLVHHRGARGLRIDRRCRTPRAGESAALGWRGDSRPLIMRMPTVIEPSALGPVSPSTRT